MPAQLAPWLALGILVLLALCALAVLALRIARHCLRRAVPDEPDTVAALEGTDVDSDAARDRVDRLLNLPPEVVRRDFTAQRYRRDAFEGWLAPAGTADAKPQGSLRELVGLRVLESHQLPRPLTTRNGGERVDV